MERGHRRLGGGERRQNDGYLNDGTACGDLDGDVAHVHTHHTGQVGAELQRGSAGEIGGITCDGKGGRNDDRRHPTGWNRRR